ncbi:MAG: hypothetical protein PHH82_01080 [Candidatus ainarchaeum sp.]|nr:hypothetical protein [Candidatus ainarchaeum sp.]
MYSFLWIYLKHKKEMFLGHIKSLILRLTIPKQYKLIRSIKGNHKELFATKKKLLKELKFAIKFTGISCDYISRIKTIHSINRKYYYCKIVGKELKNALTDFIGIKILPKTEEDCHKVLDLILKKYKLQKIKGMKNPENFFGSVQKHRDTDSKITNQIYVKIIFNKIPVHIMIQPQSEINTISKNRAEYIRSIMKTIKENKGRK